MSNDFTASLKSTKTLKELMAERQVKAEARAEEVKASATEEIKVPVSNVKELVFRPCKEQRELKAKFYMAIKGLGIDTSGIDIDTVERYVPCEPLANWWTIPGFVDWFKNAEAHKQKVRMLLDRQLELLEEIQENREGLYSIKDILAAGKQILEYKKAFEDEEQAEQSIATSDEETVKRIAAKILETKRLAAAQKERNELRGYIELPS